MGIRKITFDNGDIVLAKDQAILYDLLLKQQTKTLLPKGETIYQNSTGFLIQNESEKLKYINKNTVYGLEFIFNSQLYLSVCGRIIKLEKDSKYLFDWNDIENNETYYIVIRVDLNKEAKIINGELKEFGNPIEIKISNTVSGLIQNNLNQKSNNGIYKFPLISFKAKFKKNINALETIENIKDESTYLLPLLMESSRNQSKLLTITQKIQEEKELLQEKQNQLKNIKSYLTNLEYRKMQELNELETYIQNSGVYQLENFKQVYPNNKPFDTVDNKWYVIIWRGNQNNAWNINKFHNSYGGSYYVIDEKSQIQLLFKNNEYFFGIKEFYNDKSKNKITISKNEVLSVIKEFEIYDIDNNYIKSVYRWDGIGNPNIKGKTVHFFDLIR